MLQFCLITYKAVCDLISRGKFLNFVTRMMAAYVFNTAERCLRVDSSAGCVVTAALAAGSRACAGMALSHQSGGGQGPVGGVRPQDKLHQNLCRQRSLVAIGTHDLGALRPPFTYEALPPEAITFVPLKQTRAFRADELLAVRPCQPATPSWERLRRRPWQCDVRSACGDAECLYAGECPCVTRHPTAASAPFCSELQPMDMC